MLPIYADRVVEGLYVVTGGGESASRGASLLSSHRQLADPACAGLPYVREPSPTTAELFSFVESASDQELRSWKASPKGSLSEEEEGTDAFPQLQGTPRDVSPFSDGSQGASSISYSTATSRSRRSGSGAFRLRLPSGSTSVSSPPAAPQRGLAPVRSPYSHSCT